MHVVLGAGLSGLSLAVALVRAGVTDVVVVDKRTAFTRDRTWGTWAAPGLPFLECADARWHAWEVRVGARTGRGTSTDRPYVHIPADAFYAAALRELAAAGVEVRLGVRVLEAGDGWARTSAGRLVGTIHDARGLASPAFKQRRRGAVELWQGFLGWEVETDQPVFDPTTAVLMDFVGQKGTVPFWPFVYVLPFSETRALVEHTTFAPRGPTAATLERALRAYLGDVGFRVLREERGRLPMTTATLPARRGEHASAVGIAGGAMRASSGYAFSRVQAHSQAIARAVAEGRPLPEAPPQRRAALDAAFLRALADDPGAFPERFRTLVDRMPGDAFARFMTDASTLADEALAIAALPPLPFAWAGLRALAARG